MGFVHSVIILTVQSPHPHSYSDPAPILIMWFFDSRSGMTYGANSTAVPDWVDASVAGWIESETKQMEAVWGPGEDRGAIAFVHIPP